MLRRLGHDLRSPLVNIKMGLQIVQQGEELDLCEDLITEVTRMDQMVEGLLDYVRSSEPQRSSTRLDSLIHQTIGELTVPAGVQIFTEVTTLRSLEIDPDLHLKLLRKLLSNALKAVGRNGRIGVYLVESQGRIVLRVDDSGPGIAPDLLPELFEPGAGKWKDGLGLGLAFARATVQAHGGEIYAGESPTLGGASLVVSYPVQMQ